MGKKYFATNIYGLMLYKCIPKRIFPELIKLGVLKMSRLAIWHGDVV